MAEAGAARAGGLAGTVLKACALAAVLLVAGIALRGRAETSLKLLHADAHGAVMLVLAGAALCALGAPRQAVAFAGGFVFGPWQGGALALLAQGLGCAADYAAARLISSKQAGSAIPAGRVGDAALRIGAVVRGNPFAATLTLRLLPAGNNLLLNLAAGAAGIPAGAFISASILGYVPQTLIFALLGSGTQLGQTTQALVAIGLFAASLLLGFWLLQRQRARS